MPNQSKKSTSANSRPSAKTNENVKRVASKPQANADADVLGAGDGEFNDAALNLEPDDEDAIAAFFQEAKDDLNVVKEIRKVSLAPGQVLFKLGPDFIDEDYFECTPVPLYQQTLPLLEYGKYLDKAPEDIVVITPIKPQRMSELFEFYRNRGPAFDWDPNLTDIEEDCFFLDAIKFPTSKLAYAIPHERRRDKVKKRRLKVFKPDGDYVINTRLFINLTETETFMLLDLSGHIISETDDSFKKVQQKNERYIMMENNHIDSPEMYVDNCSQTFENHTLDSYTDYKIRECGDKGTDCHAYYIEDEYINLAAEEVKLQELKLEQQLLAERAKLDAVENTEKDSDSGESSEEDEGALKKVDLTKYKDEEERWDKNALLEDASEDEVPMSSGGEEEFEIKNTLEVVYQNIRHRAKHKGPRLYPDITFSAIAIERILSMDASQLTQAFMRGFVEPEEPKKKAELVTIEDESGNVEVLDEDAMVDLLIQQHRQEEESAKDEHRRADEDVVPVTAEITEAELAKIKADLGESAVGEEIVVVKEEVKQEEKIEVVVEEESLEKDEFDLAIEGLLTDHSTAHEPDVKKIADRPKEEVQKDTETHEHREDELKHLPKFDKVVQEETPELQRVKVKQGEKELLVGTIQSEWNDADETMAEMREAMENGIDSEEFIEETPCTLKPATASALELASIVIKPKEKQQHVHPILRDGIVELGYGFQELKNKKKTLKGKSVRPDQESQVSEKDGTTDGEEEMADKDMKMVDEDDISSDTEKDEDSKLSDHVIYGHESLDDSSDTDSEDNNLDFKTLVKSQSSAHKIVGVQKERERMDELDYDKELEGPSLKKYWLYKTPLIGKKEVTDIALHPLNGNIIAVSYGTCRFGMTNEPGVVCIWNAKNDRNPEKVYHLNTPATTVAFSEFTPYVLAVGTLDGNIVLYDLRSTDSKPAAHTFAQHDKHLGPVWLILWLVEEDTTSETSIVENMLSLGDDGVMKKWNMTRNLESLDCMKVMRSTMLIPGRREKRSESLITTLSNAYSVAYFPDNTDLFLLGTEEGFIHKCSSAYKDQYVGTYVGHTGPVYKVAFSPFEPTIFISCGGDWTVRIWRTESFSPLLTMMTGHRTIFDVTWSLYSSTIFICCAEFHGEIWDITLNTLEPTVTYKSPADLGLRKVAFSAPLNSVLIGDDEGGIHVFGLRNFPRPPSSKLGKCDVLLEALIPGYKRKSTKERKINPSKPSIYR